MSSNYLISYGLYLEASRPYLNDLQISSFSHRLTQNIMIRLSCICAIYKTFKRQSILLHVILGIDCATGYVYICMLQDIFNHVHLLWLFLKGNLKSEAAQFWFPILTVKLEENATKRWWKLSCTYWFLAWFECVVYNCPRSFEL